MLDAAAEKPPPGATAAEVAAVRARVLLAGRVLGDAVGFALDIPAGRLPPHRLVGLATAFVEYLGTLPGVAPATKG